MAFLIASCMFPVSRSVLLVAGGHLSNCFGAGLCLATCSMIIIASSFFCVLYSYARIGVVVCYEPQHNQTSRWGS